MSPIPQAVAAAAAATALLVFSTALPKANCWAVLLPVAAIAWLLWSYQREQVMFGRRLILESVATPGGRIKALFWPGTLSKLLRVPVALVWAALLLAMASQLRWSEWAILAADTALLIWLTPAVRRLLAGEVAPAHVGTVARRWPTLLANTLLLTLAFTAHDFWAGFPDSRNLSWSELADQAVRAGRAAANCAAAGWLVGVVNLAEQLPRHAAMLLLPGVVDPMAKVVAWLAFLGVTGFGGYLFTRLLLGAQSIAEQRFTHDPSLPPSDRSDGLFLAATAALVTAVLLISSRAASVDWWSRLEGVPEVVAKSLNPCGALDSEARELKTAAHREIDETARAAIDDAMRQVDTNLAAAFDAANAGVDAYLDWYFSYVGSYTRLGALVIPRLDERIRSEFTRAIFDGTEFDGRVKQLGAEADRLVIGRFAATTEEIGRGLSIRLGSQPCVREVIRPAALPRLSRDAIRASLSAAIAVPLSRVALHLAGQAARGALARSVARQSMKAAASAAGGTVGRRSAAVVMSAGAAALVCAPGGLLAVGCSALAGVVTWLGVDVALIAIDEALFRDKMKKEIVAELAAQRDELRESIRLQLEQTVTLYRLQARNAVDAVFVPARDG